MRKGGLKSLLEEFEPSFFMVMVAPRAAAATDAAVVVNHHLFKVDPWLSLVIKS
jgi:hypothetical protein